LGLIDCSPRNPAIRDQAAALASIENELSMAMLANGYLTNSPFRLVGIYVHFDGPPGSHALAREWITSGMSIVTTIAFSRKRCSFWIPESRELLFGMPYW
jgi:hypothetical protein